MAYDPYTIYVALNSRNQAQGSHYEDNYRSMRSSHTITYFSVENGTLKISTTGNAKGDDYKTPVERVVVLFPNGQHLVIKTRNQFLTTSEASELKLF